MTRYRPLSRSIRLLCACLCLAAVPAAAQFIAKTVVFEGATPYSQPDLQAAAALKPGSAFTQDSLAKTAQRLQDTGAFADVQAAVAGPPDAMAITFKVTPRAAAQMLAVTFVNFPWSPAALAAELHQRVPLFNGTLPEAGNLQTTVTDALEKMLAAKQISTSIATRVLDATPTHPTRTLEFRIDTPAAAPQ